MKKFFKIILWLIGITFLLFAITFGFGRLMVHESGDMVVEAEAFSQSTDKSGCLSEMADRVSRCDGPSCLVSSIGFGGFCLENASGDVGKYCIGRQAATTLPENYCEPYQSSKYCAQAISGAVSAFCKGDFSD